MNKIPFENVPRTILTLNILYIKRFKPIVKEFIGTPVHPRCVLIAGDGPIKGDSHILILPGPSIRTHLGYVPTTGLDKVISSQEFGNSCQEFEIFVTTIQFFTPREKNRHHASIPPLIPKNPLFIGVCGWKEPPSTPISPFHLTLIISAMDRDGN
jgi:hypothetical protein